MERVDLAKSVPNSPTYEEYFGLEDNILVDEDFELDNKDEEIKKMLIIMLGLLEEFYIEHMYDTAYYYASEQFKEDIDEFNRTLKENLAVLWAAYVATLVTELDAAWQIPADTVDIQFELDQLIASGMDTVIYSLFYDLRDKADYYKEMALVTGTFSPHSNFRRAIKRLANQVDFKSNQIRKIINRKYQEFVYGQDALFIWVCSGRNTCAWCYTIEAKGAMPLSWFPLDHINGECVLKPVYPDKYSDEYNQIIKA